MHLRGVRRFHRNVQPLWISLQNFHNFGLSRIVVPFEFISGHYVCTDHSLDCGYDIKTVYCRKVISADIVVKIGGKRFVKTVWQRIIFAKSAVASSSHSQSLLMISRVLCKSKMNDAALQLCFLYSSVGIAVISKFHRQAYSALARWRQEVCTIFRTRTFCSLREFQKCVFLQRAENSSRLCCNRSVSPAEYRLQSLCQNPIQAWALPPRDRQMKAYVHKNGVVLSDSRKFLTGVTKVIFTEVDVNVTQHIAVPERAFSPCLMKILSPSSSIVISDLSLSPNSPLAVL